MDLHAMLIRKFLGPLWALWERSPYLRLYQHLELTQYDSPPTIQTRQFSMLRAILAHAYETVPYYRNQWQQAGLHPADISNLEDFRLIPILTKAELRSHGRDLRSY